MTPLTVFVRTLMKTSAIFIGAPSSSFIRRSNGRVERPVRSGRLTRSASPQGRAPAEAAIDGLVGALKDSDAGVRRQAAAALGELGNARAVPGTHRGAEGRGRGRASARDRRRSARSAIARGHRRRSRRAQGFVAQHPRARRHGARRARRPHAVDPLIAAITRRERRRPPPRRHGARRDRRRRARSPALTAALKDEDAGVRRAAMQAIAEISDGDDGAHHVRFRGDPHPNPNPNPNPNPESESQPEPAAARRHVRHGAADMTRTVGICCARVLRARADAVHHVRRRRRCRRRDAPCRELVADLAAGRSAGPRARRVRARESRRRRGRGDPAAASGCSATRRPSSRRSAAALVARRGERLDEPRRAGRGGARRDRHPRRSSRCCARCATRRGPRAATPRGRSARSTISARRRALIDALKDREPGVREQAAWALGALDDPAAVPALIGALKDRTRACGARPPGRSAPSTIDRAVDAARAALDRRGRANARAGRLGARRDRRRRAVPPLIERARRSRLPRCASRPHGRSARLTIARAVDGLVRALNDQERRRPAAGRVGAWRDRRFARAARDCSAVAEGPGCRRAQAGRLGHRRYRKMMPAEVSTCCPTSGTRSARS